jgi:ATP-dependent exoDNAse (exonuclease V) beta subunit
MRLVGCSPWDLLDHEQEERERDKAEAIRVAYVAATRARDLLVIPGGRPALRRRLASLSRAIYPSLNIGVTRSKLRAALPLEMTR